MSQARSILHVIAVLLIVVIAGGLGLLGTMSDVGPDEGAFDRAIMLWYVFALAGGVIGATFPKRWYLAVATAWPFLPGISIAVSACLGARIAEPVDGHCLLAVNVFLVTPLIALAGGYIGSRMRMRQ